MIKEVMPQTTPQTTPQITPPVALQALMADADLSWQVHNCKISTYTVTQDGKLPLMYHYDRLPSEVKASHPLHAAMLKDIDTPMSADVAAQKLGVATDLIKAPWFVKIIGSAVLFCERQQLAIRLKFTNTAKQLDPIYCGSKHEAINIALQHWHCFESVFVLNKSSRAVMIADVLGRDVPGGHDDNTASNEQTKNQPPQMHIIATHPEYQYIPPPYHVAILTLIDADVSANNHLRQLLDTAIHERLT